MCGDYKVADDFLSWELVEEVVSFPGVRRSPHEVTSGSKVKFLGIAIWNLIGVNQIQGSHNDVHAIRTSGNKIIEEGGGGGTCIGLCR